MNTEYLTRLLIDEIRDIYHAEKQLVRALPKMAKAADSTILEEAIHEHLTETENQVTRLEKVFSLLDAPARGRVCKGMQGLVEEGSEVIKDNQKGALRDLAIIGAAQRVEHYEISAYGTARALAEQVGNSRVAKLLQETEDEEKAADETLSQVAGEIYDSDAYETVDDTPRARSGARYANGARM